MSYFSGSGSIQSYFVYHLTTLRFFRQDIGLILSSRGRSSIFAGKGSLLAHQKVVHVMMIVTMTIIIILIIMSIILH